MKTLINIIECIVLIMTQVFLMCEKSSADNNWKNFYGVAWTGTPADNIKYAKQMGHDYIVLQKYYSKSTYIGNQNCAGLKFYIADPHFWAIDATNSQTCWRC